jgi:4-hydroxy-3-methylbut-2-enyl diphosphate reductase
MKKFDIPFYFRSPVISVVKNARKSTDPRKKNYSPSILDFGPVRFLISRHFGFCYGVENAIEIAYKTIDANPDKRIFLLSEMIHNPGVNEDLRKRGVKFIREHNGKQIISWNELKSDDIVIVPAFGTTIEIQNILKARGINPYKYDTTCPFVEKVWNKAGVLGERGFTILVHGKNTHEETIATFSHSYHNAPTVIIRDMGETISIGKIILGESEPEMFYRIFEGKYSSGFDVKKDFGKIGVVNQTTMLATETQAISGYFKSVMTKKYGIENLKDHFADTSDTLCYATYDNQRATLGLIESKADFAIVVGGYNSSNTSHIVELCEEKLPVFFISSAEKILSENEILHYDIHKHTEMKTKGWISSKEVVDIILTSGASCPDAILDEVLRKILSFFPASKNIDEVLDPYKKDSEDITAFH